MEPPALAGPAMLTLGSLSVDVHGRTDRGRVRPDNQDQFLIAALHKVVELHGTSIPTSYQRRFDSGARALLLMVADGVGGEAAGDEASSLTLDVIMGYVTNSMRCFYKLDEQVSHDLLAELALSVQKSHLTLRSQAGESPELEGMATTLTMAHVLWPHAYVVQIGDSRCYRLRGRDLLQVTRDQTLVQDLLDRGALSPEEAARSPYSSILLQAIGGGSEEVQPVISKVDLAAGDALLLCTDGLTGFVSDAAVSDILGAAPTSEAACDRLIAAALDARGSDNITAVVCRFV